MATIKVSDDLLKALKQAQLEIRRQWGVTLSYAQTITYLMVKAGLVKPEEMPEEEPEDSEPQGVYRKPKSSQHKIGSDHP